MIKKSIVAFLCLYIFLSVSINSFTLDNRSPKVPESPVGKVPFKMRLHSDKFIFRCLLFNCLQSLDKSLWMLFSLNYLHFWDWTSLQALKNPRKNWLVRIPYVLCSHNTQWSRNKSPYRPSLTPCNLGVRSPFGCWAFDFERCSPSKRTTFHSYWQHTLWELNHEMDGGNLN